jgi:ABC-type glutathione transport system ATPase component
MLELQNIHMSFGRNGMRNRMRKVLCGVSLQIRRGEITGLVGLSGCGKTTLARIAVKLIRPSSGRILLEDKDITGFGKKKMKPLRKKMQIVFQHPDTAVNPKMTLRQAVYEAFTMADTPKTIWKDRLETIAREISLPLEALDRYPYQVSGGEIQRTVLTRVFAVDPTYLILDEPKSMLDLSVQAQILGFIGTRCRREGKGILLISHDLELLRAVSDNIAVMADGKIVEQNDTTALFDRPKTTHTAMLLEMMPKTKKLETTS